ncbi:SpaA isopeptide-forming pilin-related protein [Anatilimnocola sp. NA78]|uniref:SpaA isopeptide-forming pilin-related protein n=1 Tax=Anatilimnocola sp. NA78 TaxID=3415683 RepID=UPI003CE44A17
MSRTSSFRFGSAFGSSLRGMFSRWWKRPEIKAATRRTRRRSFLEPLENRSVMASDLAAITGIVFLDTTGNGLTAGEEVSGATVNLYTDDGDGIFEPGAGDTLEDTAVTDANGEYTFEDLGLGTYWVEQEANVGLGILQDMALVTIVDDAGNDGTLIDSFQTTAPDVIASDPVGSTDSDTADAPTSEVIGGERDLLVELTASNGADSVQLTVNANGLSLNPSLNAQGLYTVTWDGEDNDGDTNGFGLTDGTGGVDLTDSGNSAGILLQGVDVDQAGGSATVRIYTSAGNFSELNIVIPDAGINDLFLKYDDFTIGAGAGATFTNVTAIELEIDSTIDAMDGNIDLVRAIGYSFVTADFDNFVESDLELTKDVSDNAPNVGDQVTFTITVSNLGPDGATGIEVTDLLPAGLTFVSETVSQGTYDEGTGIWLVGNIAANADATLTVTATVTSLGAKTNTATITDLTSTDLDTSNNTDSEIVTPQSIDLALTKTVNNATVGVGQNVTFTIIVANTGVDDATGVEVTDLLPAGFTYVSETVTQGTYDELTGIWTVGAVNTGDDATLTITATKNAAGAVINTAQVSDADQTDVDSTPGNFGTIPGEDDGASVTVNDTTIDLAVTKTVDNATQSVGQNVVFTITVSNTGLGNATGVEVTDLLPAGLTFVSGVASTGTYLSGTGVWTVGTVNTGSSATLTLTATVATVGAKTNSASVTDADQTDVDSTPGNFGTAPSEDDGASATVTPPAIDLSITKTVNNATQNVGQNVVFTIIVSNSNAVGIANATGVVVTDLLPAGLTFVSATQTVGTYVSGTGVWTVGNLNAGASATLTITATVASVGAKINAAEVTAATQPDLDSTPGNGGTAEDDRATATVTPPQVDLSLTKTVNGGATATANKNQNVTYVLTVSNATGQSNATGVVVTDLLPAGLTFVSSTPSVGSYNSTTGVWTVGNLNAGANATLTVVVTVTTSGVKVNTAEVTAVDQGDLDSTPNNRGTAPNEDDTASATVTPNVSDLSVTKTVDIATPNRNQNVVFTITLANGGPQTATNVNVTDVLPAGMTFVSNTASTGTYNSTTGVWTVPSLNSGANATLTITATTATVGAKTNTAAVTASEQFDNDSTPGNQATVPNEDDTASVTVTPVATDLSVTKTVNDTTPEQGDNLTFLITVSNTSAVNATNVVVTDLLPAGLTFVSATASQGTYVNGTGLWTIGTINANGNVTLTVVATVTNNSTKVNTAQVTSLDQFDIDSIAGNSVATEDDQASVTVEPFLLSKRLCVVR